MVQKIKELISSLFKKKPETEVAALEKQIRLQVACEKAKLARIDMHLMLTSHQSIQKAKIKASLSAYKKVLTMIKEGADNGN